MRDRQSQVEGMRVLVKAYESSMALRIEMSNRLGKKADGGKQKIAPRHLLAADALVAEQIMESAKENEKFAGKQLEKRLKQFPIYNQFLKPVKGVGSVISAYIISYIDIHEASTVSKIWQFCGLNSGMVPGKKRIEHDDGTHSVIVTDTMIRGDRLTKGFNSPYCIPMKRVMCHDLPSALCQTNKRWKPVDDETWLATPEAYRETKPEDVVEDGVKIKRLVRGQKIITSPYAKVYYDYKWRLTNSVQETECRVWDRKAKEWKTVIKRWCDTSDQHRHRAASRYTAKMFCIDLYVEWRTLEGLEVRLPYHEAVLGHKHSA
jgi:hypothetical protein